jgi:Domain of unknown function (DUF6458)
MTIGISIFLIAVGAILRYATNFDVQDVSVDTVGLILMIAGAAGLLLGFLQEMIWSDRAKKRAVVEQPVAQERVVERRPEDPPRY